MVDGGGGGGGREMGGTWLVNEEIEKETKGILD